MFEGDFFAVFRVLCSVLDRVQLAQVAAQRQAEHRAALPGAAAGAEEDHGCRRAAHAGGGPTTSGERLIFIKIRDFDLIKIRDFLYVLSVTLYLVYVGAFATL